MMFIRSLKFFNASLCVVLGDWLAPGIESESPALPQ